MALTETLATKLRSIHSEWAVSQTQSDIAGSSKNAIHYGNLDVWCDSAGIADRRSLRRLDYTKLAKDLYCFGAAAICDLTPPFRIFWNSSSGYHAVADWPGLAQLFFWQGPGIAAVSSSATLIAKIFGLRPDINALLGPALIGSMIGQDSPIQGVQKLPLAQMATLMEGSLSFSAQPSPSRLFSTETAFIDAVTSQSLSWPTAEVEVSGGFDSRLIVAALTSKSRRQHQAVTLGREDDLEVITARNVCNIAGISQTVYDPQIRGLTKSQLQEAVKSAADRDDYSSNPIDRVAINLFNDQRVSMARFSGQNGEIFRGFYYPGQPLRAKPSLQLARRLTRWRLFSNDLVDSTIFDQSWYRHARATAATRLQMSLLAGEGDWGQRLDAFYLEQRMQRWCGTAISAAINRRAILLPFFDPDVIIAALTTSPGDKNNSRFAARMLCSLDPDLGRVPTDTGESIEGLANGGVWNSMRTTSRLLLKASRKIGLQIVSSNTKTFASQEILDLVFSEKILEHIDMQKMFMLGMLSQERVESIVSGRERPSRSTVGFLLNLDYLLKSLGKHIDVAMAPEAA